MLQWLIIYVHMYAGKALTFSVWNMLNFLKLWSYYFEKQRIWYSQLKKSDGYPFFFITVYNRTDVNILCISNLVLRNDILAYWIQRRFIFNHKTLSLKSAPKIYFKLRVFAVRQSPKEYISFCWNVWAGIWTVASCLIRQYTTY